MKNTTYDQLERKVLFYRILVPVMILLFIADFIGSYGIYKEKEHQSQELKAWKASSEIWKLNAKQQEADCQGYKDSNKLLFEYCDPSGINKAIKKTNLPKLVVNNG